MVAQIGLINGPAPSLTDPKTMLLVKEAGGFSIVASDEYGGVMQLNPATPARVNPQIWDDSPDYLFMGWVDRIIRQSKLTGASEFVSTSDLAADWPNRRDLTGWQSN